MVLQQPYPELTNAQHSQTGQVHMRRKSVLPGQLSSMSVHIHASQLGIVDAGVLRDLQAHRSLDDQRGAQPPAEI